MVRSEMEMQMVGTNDFLLAFIYAVFFGACARFLIPPTRHPHIFLFFFFSFSFFQSMRSVCSGRQEFDRLPRLASLVEEQSAG